MRIDDGSASFWNFLHITGFIYGIYIAAIALAVLALVQFI
jgi:hypothetical protein